ncbi:MAG: non-ribosomal peptide synthetase [Chloroflexota bacterium]
MNSRVTPRNLFIEFTKDEIEQSIPQRFEKIVRAYPNRVAIKTKTAVWTYESLNCIANGIADRILNGTPNGNQPIGILMERGAAALIAVLAVLKSGKIYLPLDPSYPAERLQFMLHDSEPQLIVTNRKNLDLCRGVVANNRIPIVDIDEIGVRTGARNPGIVIPPDAFASILYTSGSTGMPKGVVDSHRNILHGTLRFTNGLHIHAGDRLTLTHSCSSSASVRRIFPALLNGASLYPVDLNEEGMEGLLDVLVSHRITYFSTGRIRDVVHALGKGQGLDELRLVSFGGEIVHKADVELCRRIFPPDCLVGIWMSTTETGNITQYFIDSDTQIEGDIAPIGYPAEDVEVLLLGDEGRSVDPGEPGEIVVKSRYLSPGYWRRPDLTNAKFFPDPNGGEDRLYFTGDVGRMDLQGCLYHLGRKDDQVKIRGYRVETAETEAALIKIAGIRKAFVTAREIGAGDKQLVAYVVPDIDPVPTAMALRNVLAQYLPDYMMPSAFVMLEDLPLTPAGKVDRSALPAPTNKRPDLAVPYAAPRNIAEEELEHLWREALRLDRVGIHDSFFDLGGDSLSAMRLVSAVIEAFHLRLPVQALFQSPTIAEMASVLAANKADQRLSNDELARVVTDLESLTDLEAQRLFSEANKPAGNKS